jgi:hypothetical protein
MVLSTRRVFATCARMARLFIAVLSYDVLCTPVAAAARTAELRRRYRTRALRPGWRLIRNQEPLR